MAERTRFGVSIAEGLLSKFALYIYIKKGITAIKSAKGAKHGASTFATAV